MPSQRQAIHASSAPKPNGNYSHVVREGNTLHIAKRASQIPNPPQSYILDPFVYIQSREMLI
ncbi:hypothetical protein D6D22_06372 [Aureobasidium pullulans]|uniref:Uncharacterized protein n=1 Tax=Aureobasidium pullulans TaxID=5580 RepID=A0A4S8XGT7_AURPU|nr:hypothetical protein D6D22_06372 [Aureobasidium pullulans]